MPPPIFRPRPDCRPGSGLLAGIVLTSFVALVLGYITLHLGGHYLPLTTIAWGMAIYYSFGNFQFLGSHGGIGDIPPVSLFGYSFDEPQKLYYIIWVSAARRCSAPPIS